MPGLRIIKVRDGSQVTPGRELPMGEGVHIIGRSLDAQIHLDDPTVGREHVRIWAEGNLLHVEILSERATTYVDGAAVSAGGTYRLRVPGGRLQLGGVMLEITGDPETKEFGRRLDGATLATGARAASAGAEGDDYMPLLRWRWENGEAHIWCAGRRVDLRPSAARALATLLEFPGEPVHSLTIQEAVGGEARVDQLMTYVRNALRPLLEEGVLPRARIVRALRAASGRLDRATLEKADESELLRLLIQSRRGYGYVLNLPAEVVELLEA